MKRTIALMTVAVWTSATIAAPTGWSSGYSQGVRQYTIGGFGEKATNLMIHCPTDGTPPKILTQVDGALPPSNEQVGFKAAGRTFAIRAGGSGDVTIDSPAKGTSFVSLWSAIRAGSSIDISYTDGRHATLPLTGSGKAMPASPCGGDFVIPAKKKKLF